MTLLFDLHFPNTIIYGAGSLLKIGDAVEQLGVNRLFIILSKRAKSEMELLQNIAATRGFEINFFTDYSGEPTTDHVEAAINSLQECGADCVVGIGGGTPIDLAKAVSVLAANKGLSIMDIQNHKQLQRYPLIAIPTTAGTGSEVTKITVITDVHTTKKYNPAHPRLIPDIAIIDPKLTLSLPKHITAQTGMDALAHAVESYVSTRANPISDLYAKEAMVLISAYLLRAYHNPDDLEAREGMLRASCYAGIAFSNASTNLAHATARPLGTRFNVPHGLSVALTLPPVIEFGSNLLTKRYEDIAELLGTKTVIAFVKQYNQELNIYEQARNMINSDKLMKAIPILIDDALSGNGILTNAKVPTEKDVEKVYEDIIKQLMEG